MRREKTAQEGDGTRGAPGEGGSQPSAFHTQAEVTPSKEEGEL